MPLVDCMVMNQCRFDLNRAEEAEIFYIAVVYVECDERFLGGNIAAANMK